MSAPLVLITIGYKNNVTPYAQAVARAGAIPLVAYAGDEGFTVPENVAGVVLGGGASVEPSRYNAEHDPTIKRSTDVERDDLEFSVLDQVIPRGVPILGICRGLQLLNVYHRGSLHQFLGYTDYKGNHRPEEHRAFLAHTVEARAGRLAELLGEGEIHVNSIHRQGIDTLGEGLKATVYSPDGLIEGVETDDGSILAVQWHPEELALTDPPSQRLFSDLVDRARAYSRRQTAEASKQLAAG
ncbi:gamma-glutamyl-gamma-aminobutyrate hydrolase family protein [Arthrobacter sp. ISL-95]|uniref:gamma-glutamyl-gamma-aminobutyrate hydrolase family protein n=1 Tax=Arthrobacter sp. ISL-95 TaxID=2819116 RepID=UPI001BECD69B|nr:gamma-glutamyl-gamma-aminobutyrate hydrolase family protein [Arthrobacter sp. ISL-95]MBT2588363.1 gamma-glutamyl-gamma-aminobutyrate hydrolase family protein [Arthrobacter sp. ISL-95]